MNVDLIKKQPVTMILKFSVPAIISMVLTALITIADGYFIGNTVGEKGISAINLGLPMVYIFLGVGIMIGVGGVSIAGRLLGAGDIKESNRVFNQTIRTSIIASCSLSMIIFIGLIIVLSVTNLDLEVVAYMKAYYIVMFITYPFMMLNSGFGMFIRGEGKPQVFMLFNIITVFINIILDYILISRLGLGVRGAAIASLISVVMGTIFMVRYFINTSQHFAFAQFKFSKSILQETVFNGSSELIGQLSAAISMLVFNVVIIREAGISGVAAFTVVGYTSYIFTMIVIGFGQGFSPLISYAYGGKALDLCVKLRRKTNVLVFGVGTVIMCLLQVLAPRYATWFVDNNEISEMIVLGIRVFTVSFMITGFNVISSFYFTAIGKAKESALISASRGLVVLLISIIVLPLLFGITGIWLVAPVTEAITLVLTTVLVRQERKDLSPYDIIKAVN